MGRRRRGGDEKELAGVRQGQVLLGLGLHRGGGAKVDPAPVAEDLLVVPDPADGDGVVNRIERRNDSAEAAEGGPAVDAVAAGNGLGDQLADLFEVVGKKNIFGLEVGQDEGVGGGNGLLEGWDVAEIERERGSVRS